MEQPQQIRQHPHTVMFVDAVEPGKQDAFLDWSRSIHEEAEKFDGFLDVTVIQSDDDDSSRFMTLLRFDNQPNLENWMQSESSEHWVSDLSGILREPEIAADGSGSNLWFKFQPGAKTKKPPLWKEVVLGTAVVYPMILILNFLMYPLIGGLPTNAAIFVVVVVLSALLANPIMPFVNKVLGSWLYGKSPAGLAKHSLEIKNSEGHGVRQKF